MDVADADVPPTRLQRLAQQPRVRQAILHDVPIPREAEMNEIEVLRNDLRAWPRKVQCVRLLRAAEIVQLEDQVLGQLRLVAPDDEAHPRESKAELVAGGIDALDARELEIPLGPAGLGMGKGRDEASRRGVDVDGDVDPRLCFVGVEDLGDFLDGLVVARVRAAKDDEDADRVLVNVLLDEVRVEAVVALLAHVEDPRLDLEVAGEFFECDLGVGAHDDVGLRRVLARGTPLLLPAALHGQAAEVDGFGGARRRGADSLFALLHAPEVREDGDAAGVHVHHGWVLVRVGHVLGEVFDHEGFGFALDVSSYKAGVGFS